ncbi:MAG: ATP-dependent Clp protease proteolytic subunit [Elusimicrobiales bacterium]|nr:ATP-dependent Clp protease proteolytic subunit [Elusimicrobiales bacterium]
MKKIFFLMVIAFFINNLNSQVISTITVQPKSDEIIKMSNERDLLKAQYDAMIQKEKNKLISIESLYNSTSLENRLFVEKINKELSDISAQLQKISIENKLADEKQKKELSVLSLQLARLKMLNDIETEKQKQEKFVMENEKAKMDFEIKKLAYQTEKAKYEVFLKQSEADKLKAEIDIKNNRDEINKQINKDIKYSTDVFRNGALTISDRRIPLNGVITMNTADYIVNRINYFNNISTAPIFIVIDRSPGGSVMAGYKILKAMDASVSPVYVVVKSFAASMAATITTLAKKSFVYPNAIILHHQMSTMTFGNMTQLKEQLEISKKWEKRLMGPIAKKIGMDMEEFRKKMYENNSDGDWEEFGDSAVNLKWADSVADNIVEEGIVKDPDYFTDKRFVTYSEEKIDEKGKKYVELPRLDPFDFYFLYNPDSYYKYNY